MFYTVYKTTNNINGMVYVGAHKTSDLEDDYMGSGKYLQRAINKYGLENFTKEILKVFESSEEMFNMESVIVNEDFVNDKNTYNLKVGGFGGFDHLIRSGYIGSEKHLTQCVEAYIKRNMMGRERIKWLRENDLNWTKRKIEKFKISIKKYFESNDGHFKGKNHTNESIKQMKETHKKNKHAQGEKNSQFGSMWIYSLTEQVSKKIQKEEFQTYEKDGWLKGRKMKF